MKKFDKIYEFLASRQGQRFTAKEVAEHLALHDNEFSARKSNYSSNDVFIEQISREVYSTIYKYNDQVGKDGVVRSVLYDPNSKPRAFFVDLSPSTLSLKTNSPANSQMTLFDKIYSFLYANEGKSFSPLEIALELIKTETNISSRQNDYSDQKTFENQIAAEVRSILIRKEREQPKSGFLPILMKDTSKPREYFVDSTKFLPVGNLSPQNSQASSQPQVTPSVVNQFVSNVIPPSNSFPVAPSNVISTGSMSANVPSNIRRGFSEHDLYPVLMNWLFEDQNIRCRRIDENRSSNSLGSGGNFWRHPDIVGFEDVSTDWEVDVRECAKNGNFSPIRWFSYEVKKELNLSNTRECFFQALSNSSWANEGYLVTAGISEKKKGIVTNELRELSDDYGIGVILLDYNEPSKSKVLFQAKRKEEVNWRAIDRVCKENPDFKDYVERVNDYHKTSRIRENDWRK